MKRLSAYMQVHFLNLSHKDLAITAQEYVRKMNPDVMKSFLLPYPDFMDCEFAHKLSFSFLVAFSNNLELLKFLVSEKKFKFDVDDSEGRGVIMFAVLGHSLRIEILKKTHSDNEQKEQIVLNAAKEYRAFTDILYWKGLVQPSMVQ